MKKTILLLVLVTAFVMNQNTFGQATDLIISEYIEGSNNNKALEVFNGTGAILDMTQYRFVRYNNGGSVSPSGTFDFIGTLADGEVYVIANSASFTEILNVADTTHSITFYNGNDYIGLEKFVIDEWLVIDVIGVLGVDTFWDVAGVSGATGEQTLVRKADVCSPQTNWTTSAGSNATDSEWIVYDQNDFNYIGNHSSSCTGPVPLNANFSADNTTITTGSSVNYTDMTTGGSTPYTYEWDLDGDGAFDDAFIANPTFIYNSPGTYEIALRVTDNDLNVDTETKVGYVTVITPIDVTDLAALRSGIQGEVYRVTGEVVLTFQQDFRNQKYIQDGSAAILIDDDPGVITTIYNIEDGITNIVGTLGEFGNMTQLLPLTDPGPATPGYSITPQIVSIDDLNDSFDDYEAELVQLLDVTFTDGGSSFANGLVYEITDVSKAIGNFRTTFYFVDYIGTTIPVTANIVVLPNARTDGNYVTSRFLADIEGLSNPAAKLAITSVNGGADPYVNADFSMVVQAQDAAGDPAFVSSDVNFTFSTNDPPNVDFTVSSTTTGTIINGTSEVIVTGVQMAPIGANVTITAKDDLLFGGLLSGTSLPFDVIELVIPDLIITEIMQNPDSVGDSAGEWFEVYNNSASAINMTGWVMEDLGTNSHTIAGPLTIPAYGFAVLGNNADPLLNGGYTCDYEYSSFTLGNSDDEIILFLPDGITEVNRVEWDGGPIWPDPTGASMVYTGIASEENNNGALWSTAIQVELSYPDPACDYGSPGSNGSDQVLTEGFSLDLNVLLEGFYNLNTDDMNNYFRQNNLLPYLQPFMVGTPYYGNNTPLWDYSGIEISPYIASITTDWILLEIRDGISGPGTFIPAFVEKDGQVCSYNGSSRISLKSIATSNMYIVVYHINHLAIMSANGINPGAGTVVNYDFSTGSDKVYGGTSGYKEIETGVWGMVAGDINADGVINQLDNTDGWASEVGEEGAYQGSNLYNDGQINNLDKNELWAPNINTSSQVPN